MARPRGRQKTARLTVNLDDHVYGALQDIANRQDAALSWVVRRAVCDYIDRENSTDDQPALPLIRSNSDLKVPRP